ncbi:MAG: hypothetical protein BM563_02165 [Bacteroidetes bacterium MedPE-SWsnd-G1]|nr:MAG: hypothetical protein BM563_02165 [Bacteroidetes bacterium MedPE-SWsnd-G1]
MRVLLILLISIVSIKSIAQSTYQALASGQLPIIEIKDFNGKLVKSIKLPEVVILASMSKDDKHVFALSSDKIYRIHIETNTIKTIENQFVLNLSQETNNGSLTALSGFSGMNRSVENTSTTPVKSGHTIKTEYANFPYGNLTNVYLYKRESWYETDSDFNLTLVENPTIKFFKADFENEQLIEIGVIKTKPPYIIGSEFGKTEILYILDSSKQLKNVLLNSFTVNNLFEIENEDFQFIEKLEQNVITAFNGILTINNTDYSNKIKKELKYDLSSNQLLNKIKLEGDAFNAVEYKFNNTSIWWYLKVPNEPKLEQLKYPDIPEIPENLHKRKVLNAHNLKMEKYKIAKDSIDKLNQIKLDQFSELTEQLTTKLLVFKDSKLQNILFEFEPGTLRLISETVISIEYQNGTTEEYDINTKKLLKTYKAKPTSIDKF